VLLSPSAFVPSALFRGSQLIRESWLKESSVLFCENSQSPARSPALAVIVRRADRAGERQRLPHSQAGLLASLRAACAAARVNAKQDGASLSAFQSRCRALSKSDPARANALTIAAQALIDMGVESDGSLGTGIVKQSR